jgi:Ribosomal protein S4/S9 N-terminal domain/S4 domain
MTFRPKVRLSRRVGAPLTPKSQRFFERRPYPPGVHGRRRRNQSDYRLRLQEKQRLRYQYDLREKQLRRTFEEATRRPGKAGENLIELLELRLDAVVLRSGFARTIYQARQMIVHGHFAVDGRKVDGPRTGCGRVRPSRCGRPAGSSHPSPSRPPAPTPSTPRRRTWTSGSRICAPRCYATRCAGRCRWCATSSLWWSTTPAEPPHPPKTVSPAGPAVLARAGWRRRTPRCRTRRSRSTS